jgi:hypothetical protein
MEKKTFLVEEIFEDIPGDPDNVIMKLPPELCKEMGWTEGVELDITVEDGAISIKKHG